MCPGADSPGAERPRGGGDGGESVVPVLRRGNVREPRCWCLVRFASAASDVSRVFLRWGNSGGKWGGCSFETRFRWRSGNCQRCFKGMLLRKGVVEELLCCFRSISSRCVKNAGKTLKRIFYFRANQLEVHFVMRIFSHSLFSYSKYFRINIVTQSFGFLKPKIVIIGISGLGRSTKYCMVKFLSTT